MRRLFPLVLSGLMAVSFSQLAAAQSVGVQGPAGTGVNADLNKGGSTTVAPDVQNSQQIGGSNQSNQQQGSKKKERYGSASGGASSNSGPNKPGMSEQQTGDTQSRQETPAKPKY